MDTLQTLLRRYPNRIKYGILILDVFAMIIAIRTYVNYVSIETAIEEANIQQHIKTSELDFTQNFLVNYEKSEYAKYFLEHENNMLSEREYIVKFEEIYQKQQIKTWSTTSPFEYQDKSVNSPQASWNKFILEKISK